MTAANPYQQYVKQSVSTMSPAQLLVALYDKAETELKKAVYYIGDNNPEAAHNSIVRAQDIVAALDSSLKMKYEVSENLAALYKFLNDKLIEADIKKDVDVINSIIPFFTELKETFTEVSKKGF